MAEGLVTKRHVPKMHLVVRRGLACEAHDVKVANTTAIPERVTCTPCRNSTQYVDAVARRLVMNRGRRSRRAAL